MTTSKKIFITGILTTFVGIGIFAPQAYYWYRDRQVLAAVPAEVKATPTVTAPTIIEAPKVITGKPARLIIPSLKLDVAVADGVYDTKSGKWTLSWDKVHYALMTAQPNDKQGNTLIYGHRMRNGTLFAHLPSIKPGATVQVKTTNGYTFTYKFVKSKVVDPTETSIFSYDGKPMLTLQTCTGAFMQNRQLFSFEFIDVQKTK